MSVHRIVASELLTKLRAQASLPAAKRPLLVYDVRDEDHEGGHLKQSIHTGSETMMRDAHRVAASLPDSARMVAFHCTFSQVRGPSCARRVADALARKYAGMKKAGEEAGEEVEVYVVEGGFKALARLHEGNEGLFEGFDAKMHTSYWDDV